MKARIISRSKLSPKRRQAFLTKTYAPPPDLFKASVWERIDIPSPAGFPRLDQLNSADGRLYASAQWAEGMDTVSKVARKKLTCLATVYAMIEHARGNSNFRVGSNTYSDNVGALGITGVSGSRELTNMDALKTEFQSGNPVILWGPLTENPADQFGHFILAIGVNSAGQIVAHDPYGGQLVTINPATRKVSGTAPFQLWKNIVPLECKMGDLRMFRQVILGVTLLALSACDKVSSPTPEESPTPGGEARDATMSAAEAAAGTGQNGSGPSGNADSSTSGAPSDQEIKDWVIANTDRLAIHRYMTNWLRVEFVSVAQRGEIKSGYYPIIVSTSGVYCAAPMCNHTSPPDGSFTDRQLTIFFKKDPFGAWTGQQSVNGQMPQRRWFIADFTPKNSRA